MWKVAVDFKGVVDGEYRPTNFKKGDPVSEEKMGVALFDVAVKEKLIVKEKKKSSKKIEIKKEEVKSGD